MKFTDLQLNKEIQNALNENNYVIPTEIQEKAIPPGLKGKDIVGVARTGTGKTAAFLLPVLQRLHGQRARPNHPKALIIAPTRELATQITKSATTYGKYTSVNKTVVYGGVSQKPQVKDLDKGVELVIATPGRLLDLINQGHISLQDIETFILDEADRMLDMGFLPPVKKMIKKMPRNRQMMFFSATMSKKINRLVNKMFNSPVKIDVSPKEVTAEGIHQRIFFVNQHDKKKLLMDILDEETVELALIFTRTKRNADKVSKYLNKKGYRSARMHGDRSQNQRRRALNRFSNREVRVLVATDVAARGIDIDEISHVINYELPRDTENYVHRIGRTGRAGSTGVAFSLCAKHEAKVLKKIERLINTKIDYVQHRFHCDKAIKAADT